MVAALGYTQVLERFPQIKPELCRPTSFFLHLGVPPQEFVGKASQEHSSLEELVSLCQAGVDVRESIKVLLQTPYKEPKYSYWCHNGFLHTTAEDLGLERLTMSGDPPLSAYYPGWVDDQIMAMAFRTAPRLGLSTAYAISQHWPQYQPMFKQAVMGWLYKSRNESHDVCEHALPLLHADPEVAREFLRGVTGVRLALWVTVTDNTPWEMTTGLRAVVVHEKWKVLQHLSRHPTTTEVLGVTKGKLPVLLQHLPQEVVEGLNRERVLAKLMGSVGKADVNTLLGCLSPNSSRVSPVVTSVNKTSASNVMMEELVSSYKFYHGLRLALHTLLHDPLAVFLVLLPHFTHEPLDDIQTVMLHAGYTREVLHKAQTLMKRE
jgi:hypothetical protein